MRLSRPGMLVCLMALSVAMQGCQSTYSRPSSLSPQPTVPVQSGGLAPVTINQSTAPPAGTTLDQAAADQAAAGVPVDGEALPPLEGAPTSDGTAVAALPGQDEAPAGAQGGASIEKDALIGGWTMTSGSTTCQLFLSLTSWKGGNRATARNCPDQTMGSVQAWSVQGRQVVLKDQGGVPVATLYPSSAQRYDGRTTSGKGIAFFR